MFFLVVELLVRRLGLWVGSALLVSSPYLIWIFVAGDAPSSAVGALGWVVLLGLWSVMSTNSICFPMARSFTGMPAPFLGSAGIGIFLLQIALHLGTMVLVTIGAVWRPAFSVMLGVVGYMVLAILYSEMALWNSDVAHQKIREAVQRPH